MLLVHRLSERKVVARVVGRRWPIRKLDRVVNHALLLFRRRTEVVTRRVVGIPFQTSRRREFPEVDAHRGVDDHTGRGARRAARRTAARSTLLRGTSTTTDERLYSKTRATRNLARPILTFRRRFSRTVTIEPYFSPTTIEISSTVPRMLSAREPAR